MLLQVPERIEQCPQLSKTRSVELNGEMVRSPDKPMKNHNIRDTEVTALNMAIDTLRWQLTQVLHQLIFYPTHLIERFCWCTNKYTFVLICYN